MKKKSSIILLSSILAFSAIGATALTSCGRDSKVVNQKYKFTVVNDTNLGEIKIIDFGTNEETNEAEKDQLLLIKFTLKNKDYELKNITANGQELEWNSSYSGFIFTVIEDNMELKVNYTKLKSTINVVLPNDGLEYATFTKSIDDSTIEVVDGKFKADIGEKIKFNVKLLRDYVITSFTLNDKDIEFKNGTNTYEFTVGEEDLYFHLDVDATSAIRIVTDKGSELIGLYLNDVKTENIGLNISTEIDVGVKIKAIFRINEDYVLLQDSSGAFNDNNEAGGYKFDETIAKTTLENNIFTVEIFEAPIGKNAIFAQTRVAEQYEYEPFVGTWKASAGVIDSRATEYTFAINPNGFSTLTIKGSDFSKSNGTVDILDNGIFRIVYSARRSIYATFVPLLKDGSITNYVVKLTGYYNDLLVLNKDTCLTDTTSKAYKFASRDQYLVYVKNTSLGLDNWYYFSDKILKKVTLSDDIKILTEGLSFTYDFDGKVIQCNVLNNEIVSDNYWVGTYTSNKIPGKTLILNNDYSYTLNEEAGTYTFDEKRLNVTLKSNDEDKIFSISLNNMKFEKYEIVYNMLSGVTYIFYNKDLNNLDDASSTRTATTFSFIDNERVHVYHNGQIDDVVDYKLSDNGELEIEFELISGYRKLKAQFNDTYTSFKFATGSLTYMDDLVGVSSTIESIVGRTFTENQTTLTLTSETVYTKNPGETSEYFIWKNDDSTITIKGEHHYKIDLITNTFVSLPDPIDYWFLNNNFAGKQETPDMETESPIILEANIKFAGDGKRLAAFEVKHYLYNFGGFNYVYSKENLKYTYDKSTHEIIINAEGTKLKLVESEKFQTLTFTHDFSLYGKSYPFNNFKVKLIK